MGPKRAADLREYRPKRIAFLQAHPTCELCSSPSADVHHKEGRGRNLNREETWMAVCRPHHDYIHRHGSWARERGYLR